MKNRQKHYGKFNQIDGFSLIEVIIVVLLLAILAAVALPELIQSRRMWRFAGMKQQLVASLRQTRQLAMTQNRRIALQYNHDTKTTRIFDNDPTILFSAPNGFLGPINDPRNIVVTLTGESLADSDIVYGNPPLAPTVLPDTVDLTTLDGGPRGTVTITFSARGDAIENTNTARPDDYGLFFYNNNGNSPAFAISVLGLGGRIRVWDYNGTVYQ